MDLTGKIEGINVDLTSDKLNIVLQVNEDRRPITDELKRLSSCEKLSIMLKQWRKKRSLDANAYYWALVSKIAEKNRTSKEEVHNLMLRRYGQPMKEEDGTSVILSVLSSIDLTKAEDIHVKRVGRGSVQGKDFTHYLLLRGSHTYDTHEMSVLIDGVVSEAKGMGIETLPPDELERMLSAWKGANAGHFGR